MPRVVSTVNLKGGTGKTTLTVALAEFLAYDGLDVLVIDIDPQTNATVSLISQDDWKARNDAGRTLAQLFADKLAGTKKFKIEDAIIPGVSNVNSGIDGLDLLPSSIDLIDVQDNLLDINRKSGWRSSPVTVLEEATSKVLGEDSEYDYVLIDCPPNLGLITQNALKISDSYLIPVIPDILSTLGIPQIVRKVKEFEGTWESTCEPLGIVLSKVRENTLHRSMTAELKSKAASGDYPEVWDTIIKDASRYAKAMDFEASVNTLKQKYGYGGYYTALARFKEEFLTKCPTT